MKQDGATVFLTTHYLSEAEALCDRIAVIDRGRIVATGTPRELVARSQAVPSVHLVTVQRTRPWWLEGVPGVEGLVIEASATSGPVPIAERPRHGRRRARPARGQWDRYCRAAREQGVARGRVPELDGRRVLMSRPARQLGISLRLHVRNPMALLYGYLFPTIFLVAFWVLYRFEEVPLDPARRRAPDGDGPRRRLLRPADDDGERAGARRVAALSADAGLDGHARRRNGHRALFPAGRRRRSAVAARDGARHADAAPSIRALPRVHAASPSPSSAWDS